MSAGSVTAVQPAQESSAEHIPERPTWRCGACGREWPCANARAVLGAEFVTCRTALLVYLAICQVDAIRDLSPGGLPPDLYGRFIGWATTGRTK